MNGQSGLSGAYSVSHGVAEGIGGFRCQRDPRQGQLSGGKEVGIQGAVISKIPDVTGGRGEQPRRIGRTAGTAEPAGTLRQCMIVGGYLAGYAGNDLQRIDIEELFTVQLNARQYGVVKSALHYIGVFAVPLQLQHFGGKEDQADGCTGFGIGCVGREIVIRGKSFTKGTGADAAGDINTALGNAVKQPEAGLCHCGLLCGGGKVCHGGVQIYRAHGMAHGVRLLTYRQMTLLVFPIFRVVSPNLPVALLLLTNVKIRIHAAHIDKMLGQFTPTFVSGDIPQPQQRQFHLRMTGITGGAFLHETAVQQRGVFLHHVQQLAVAGGFIQRYGSLHHMSGTVQLVAFQQIGEFALRVLQRVVGVQIAIRLLRLRNDVAQCVQTSLQRRIRSDEQRVRRRLDPFCYIAVLKNHAEKAIVLRVVSSQKRGCIDKIGNSMAGGDTVDLIPQDGLLKRDHRIAQQSGISGKQPSRRMKTMQHDRISFQQNIGYLHIKKTEQVPKSLLRGGTAWGNRTLN